MQTGVVIFVLADITHNPFTLKKESVARRDVDQRFLLADRLSVKARQEESEALVLALFVNGGVGEFYLVTFRKVPSRNSSNAC